MYQEETRPYTISAEEFRRAWFKDLKQGAVRPQTYHFPERVTRHNFASVITLSFRLSRGNIDAQKRFLDYLELHTGWDYRSSFRAFKTAGGDKNLYFNERRLLTKGYAGVKAHPQEGGDFWKSINYTLGAFDSNDEAFQPINVDLNLDIKQFQMKLNDYILQARADSLQYEISED